MIHKHSDYMHWAKTQSRARYNLATSGVGAYPIRELGFDCSRLEINGDNSYGFKPLQRSIAQEYGVDPECVVTSQGTSMANYLAMATLLAPGDEVVVEQPAYGLLLDSLEYIGAQIRRFPRYAETGWAVDPEEVRSAITPKTKLIVLTNLHNPTSALTPEPVIQQVASIAAEVGATLLVDEVYLDAVYENRPRSAFLLASNVVVTNSLTKVYGVSGLRCGWILAQPEMARRMWRMNDLFAATPAHPAELLAVAVFENLVSVRDRARRVVDADRATLNAFLDDRPGMTYNFNDWGTTAFLRPPVPDVDALLDRLRADYETSAVPGRFFENPEWIRLGMGVDHAMFEEGLRRLGQALLA